MVAQTVEVAEATGVVYFFNRRLRAASSEGQGIGMLTEDERGGEGDEKDACSESSSRVIPEDSPSGREDRSSLQEGWMTGGR